MKRPKARFLDPRAVQVIGTLAHNRPFAAREVNEYLRFEPGYDARRVTHTVRALLRDGYLKKVEGGKLYPTAAGWDVIEAACGVR